MVTPVRKPRLDSLTSLRFFAAFAIVLVHSEPAIVQRSKLEGVVWFGPVGVDFFFVLSGFVLTWANSAARGPKTFYWHRFARVWPLHAATWLLAIGIFLAYGDKVAVLPALAALLLLHGWVDRTSYYGAANAVSWSLSCEMFFYALFPPLARWVPRFGNRQLIRLMFGLYALMIAAAVLLQLYTHGTTPIWAQYDLPLWRLPEFVLGIILACLVERGIRLPISPRVTIVAVLASLVVLDAMHQRRLFGEDPGPPSLIFLPFACVMIMVFGGYDADGRKSVMQNRWLVRLGEWSFALYLIQWPILQVIGREPHHQSLVVAFALEAVFLVAIIGLSGATYTFFERPVERWLRRNGPGGSSAKPAGGRHSAPRVQRSAAVTTEPDVTSEPGVTSTAHS